MTSDKDELPPGDWERILNGSMDERVGGTTARGEALRMHRILQRCLPYAHWSDEQIEAEILSMMNQEKVLPLSPLPPRKPTQGFGSTRNLLAMAATLMFLIAGWWQLRPVPVLEVRNVNVLTQVARGSELPDPTVTHDLTLLGGELESWLVQHHVPSFRQSSIAQVTLQICPTTDGGARVSLSRDLEGGEQRTVWEGAIAPPVLDRENWMSAGEAMLNALRQGP